MFELMSGHYADVDRDQFERDLLEKEWVIVTYGPEQRVLGFTTLMRLTTNFQGEVLHALFSGDTVFDPLIWGTRSWARQWGRLAEGIMRERPGQPLYWLLLTATHRSYRFLPTFLREFYPRPSVPTPSIFQQRMDALVRLKFSHEYKADMGVVQSQQPLAVQAGRIDLASAGMDDEYSQFFAVRNPGFLKGDYLVCIGDLSAHNRTRLGHKFFSLGDS